MKLALAILLAYLLAGACAFGLSPEEKKIVSQMRDSISLLRAKLENAEAANSSALAALTLAAQQTTSLTEQARLASEQVAALAAERDSLTGRLASARHDYERLNARYQTAQLLIAIVSAFLVGILTLQLTHHLQPPYGLLVPIAAGTAAFFTIYNVL
jgi:hypothetical protein